MTEMMEGSVTSPQANFESFALDLGSGEESNVLSLSSETIADVLRKTHEILPELRIHEETCDAVLLTEDGGRFLVHRILMSLCSPYFRALFTSRINGHQPSREYTIPGISTDMLSLVIDFAYTGKTGVTEENVTSLLPTADQFCVARMVQDCANFLIEKMNSENCIGIRQLARNYFVLELDKAAHKYLISNFEEIVEQSEEFLELSLEDVMDLLNSDRINVRKEERVWEAGIKWIDHRPDERKQYIDSILRCIRLGLLDRQYFIENIHVHPYLENNEACKDIVRETLEFWCDFDTIIQKEDEVRMPFLATPRIPHSILFAFGGWSGGSPTNLIETFDTKADRWINIEEVDPVGPRAYHKLAVIGTDIYIIGGFNGNQYFNSCRRFNAVTREWTEVAPMHTKRCYVSVACLNNIIYALGGYDGYYRQNSAERYSSEANQWTFIAPMNLQRSDASATTLNGLIYIVGGFNGIECLSTAEYYCPMFNQWTLVTGMNQRRSGVSIIAHHGHIYVLGGFNGESRHLNGEKYNPTTNEWSPIPDMLKARSNFAIEVTDDKIFVIGGFNGLSTIGNVECYDDREELWCPATTMCAFRSALAACVISGLPNVDDYIYKQRWNLLEERRQKLLQQQAINTAMARQLAFLSDEESAEDEENME